MLLATEILLRNETHDSFQIGYNFCLSDFPVQDTILEVREEMVRRITKIPMYGAHDFKRNKDACPNCYNKRDRKLRHPKTQPKSAMQA